MEDVFCNMQDPSLDPLESETIKHAALTAQRSNMQTIKYRLFVRKLQKIQSIMSGGRLRSRQIIAAVAMDFL